MSRIPAIEASRPSWRTGRARGRGYACDKTEGKGLLRDYRPARENILFGPAQAHLMETPVSPIGTGIGSNWTKVDLYAAVSSAWRMSNVSAIPDPEPTE